MDGKAAELWFELSYEMTVKRTRWVGGAAGSLDHFTHSPKRPIECVKL